MNSVLALTPQPAGALHRVRLKALWAPMFALLWCLVGVDAIAQPAKLPAVVVWDFENQSPGAAQALTTC